MRTTLMLDDDVFERIVKQAKARRVSMGKAVSDLVRRGLTAPARAEERSGVFVFQLPLDSPQVTTEEVRRIESDDV